MFDRQRPQDDFSEELRAHLALEIDRLRAEGLSEDEAYRKARRTLGNLGAAGERFYESSRWLWLESLAQDTRHTLRRLRKAPAFAITAILTLALGIGATTSIFTLVHAVLLKSLPVSNPAQLYRLGKVTHCCLWDGYIQEPEFSIVSYDLYKHFRDHTGGFEELAAFQAGGTGLGVRRAHTSTAAESYLGEFVSGNYFAMFGVNAYVGRAITAADDRTEAAPVAIMSYRVWQQKFGLNRSVIGSVFNINNKPITVIGVSPPGFYGDTLKNPPPDFFLPLVTEPLIRGDSSMLRFPSDHWLDVIGRIRDDATPASMQAAMRVELQQWLRAHVGEMDANSRIKMPQQTLYLSPGGGGITSMREQYEHWLNILMMVSGFVLLIVCANVANLMLVRGMERRQQLSLSMALGARSTRLVRQALTESVLLSLAGGVAGLAVAFAGTRLIIHFAFQTMPGFASVPIDASPSMAVLLFTFGISLVTGVTFGIAPAWMATSIDPIEALRGANRSTRQAGSAARRTLVIVQAALSLVLLTGSGLLSMTLHNLENQNFGFEQDRRVVVDLDPLLAGYKSEQLPMFYERVHASLAAIPGVSSVASCLYAPQNGDSWNDSIFIEGRPVPGPNDDNGSSYDRVSSGFFDAIGNPMVKGRPITDQDTASSRHVAVINEAFARKFFKNENPLGKHFGRMELATAREYEIVGVAKDARFLTDNFDRPMRAFFFVPESQYTVFSKVTYMVSDLSSHYLHNVIVVLRPGAALPNAQVRRAIASVDPNMPVTRIYSMREQVAGNFSQQRLIARLTSLFGTLALVLASVGLYGVTAYNATSRRNEIGVRMALGANRGNVLALILRGAFALLAFGLLLGVPLTFAAGRFLGSQLYGMNPFDPLVIAAAILALGFSALVAASVPALRASSISPMEALRAE